MLLKQLKEKKMTSKKKKRLKHIQIYVQFHELD